MVSAIESRRISPNEAGRMVKIGQNIATDANNLFSVWASKSPDQGKLKISWNQEDAAVIERVSSDPVISERIAFGVVVTAARRGVYLDSAEGRYLGAWAFYQEVPKLFIAAEKKEEIYALENTMNKMQIVINQFGLSEFRLENGRAFSRDLVDDLKVVQALDFPFLSLSKVETIMLYLLAAGRSDRQIAQLLDFNPRTLRDRWEPLYSRLGVNNRIEAIELIRKVIEHPAEQGGEFNSLNY